MRMGPMLLRAALALPLAMTACTEKDDRGEEDEGGSDGFNSLGDEESGADDGAGELDSGEADSGGNCPPGGCLDTLPTETGSTGCMEADECGTCEVPEHVPCDGSGDPIQGMGLNCGNGEPIVNATIEGNPGASGTLAAFGTGNAFPPREGVEYTVIGSGFVDQLNNAAGNCSQDLGAYDPGMTLPAPLNPVNVGTQTCTENPGLVGSGDCSNTLQDQFEQSFASLTPGAFDLTQIKFTTTVPMGVSSLSYDFAFFSIEYPVYYGSQYNDIYIGWLESEAWTGNISFDEQGNPISLNAGFMDFLDADTAGTVDGAPHPVCPTGAGCSAPELAGTCMVSHGGTKWLSTTAPVTEGEDITVVFAIMDLGDSILDSYVFLDNFQWGCDGDQPPSTVPVD